MNRLQTMLRYVVPIALVAILAAVGAALTQGNATAATGTLGTLVIAPTAGADVDAFNVTTKSTGSSKGCPAGSTNVTGVIVGPGKWANASPTILAFTNTSAGVSTTDEFSVAMSNSMAVIAANNSLAIEIGQYDITMTCQNSLGTTKYGTFVGSITFTTLTAWTTTGVTPTATPTPTPGTTATPTPSPSPSVSATSSPTASASVSPTASPTPSPSASASASPGSSSTGTLGKLTFTPATGADIDPIQVYTVSSGTAKGCPVGGTNVTGRVVGPGEWAVGFVAVANTGGGTTGISSTEDFSVPMVNSFSVIAANNKVTLVVGRYDVTLTCQNALGTSKFGTFVGSIWFTATNRFQTTDPANSQTETKIQSAITPLGRVDVGGEATLVATLTPNTAAGKVQFRDSQNNSFTPIGGAIDVANGTATLKINTLSFGLHRVSAVFTPTSDKVFKTSTSAEIVYVVAKPLPPLPPAKATLSGTARVGSTLTCSGAFQNATSTAFTWRRGRAPISGATSASYKLVTADKGKAVSCRAEASNSGGTTSRTSAAVTVG